MRRIRGVLHLFLVGFAVWLALSAAVSQSGAQQGQPSLDLRTANGQSAFHIGERIPLKLTFSSPNDTDYVISPLLRGRGDEFDCNRFEVVGSAGGWSDPLEMYFKQDLIHTGHGWPSPPLKQAKPVEGTVDLNEWIRFDQPGDYTVRVSSFCVGRAAGASMPPLAGTLQLKIVAATPEWQKEKFEAIKPNLDLLDHPARVANSNELFLDARGDLKYLATPAAIDEMTYRLRDEKYNFADQCAVGLMGLPPAMRETAIASMNRRMEEPDFPVNQWFFNTLSFLHVAPGSDKEGIARQQQEGRPAIWWAIFSAVTKKEPSARAVTVQTLLDSGRNISTPDVREQMAALLKVSFLDLDSRSQTDDLRNQWDRLRSPEFLPVLETLARLPVKSDGDLQVFVYDRQQLKGLALKRWYELDPAGAHREILAQIGSATPSLAAQSISFLPVEQLPQFEPIWAQALLEMTSQLRERALGSLLVRFGTGAANGQMVAKLAQANPNPCDAHIVALAYLARFAPETARQKLKEEFTGPCGGGLLGRISELTDAPVLNDEAVENLNSSDPQMVRDAVHYLVSFGRKEDEAPLWARYVQWTSTYKGRADLLDRPGDDLSKSFANSSLGWELGEALMRGQGWFADSAMIARVLSRCVSEAMCSQMKNDVSLTTTPYRVSFPFLTMPGVGLPSDGVIVAQYPTRSLQLFEAKISQFPAGSRFSFYPWYRPTTSDERELEARIRAILARHGMLVVSAP